MSLGKQPVQFKKRDSIVRSVELLLLLAVAYNFAVWGSFTTLPSKLLGIFACVYVFNNWITTRSSFDIYQPAMFATDIIIFFLSMNLPNALTHSIQPWGYSPQFWILMGGMELVNIYWNLQILKASPSEPGRSGLKGWLVATAIVTCGCFVLYIYLQFSSSVFMGQLLAAGLTLSLLAMTAKWNLNRYKMAKSKGISYLD